MANKIEIPVNGGTGKLIYWPRQHKLGLPGKFGLIPAAQIDVLSIDHPEVAGAPGQQILHILAEGVLYSYGIPKSSLDDLKEIGRQIGGALSDSVSAFKPRTPKTDHPKGPTIMDYGNSPQDLLLRVASEKAAVYGISWRKRGEAFSIVPNVARKVDRLGAPGAGDTELDTRMDLVNYLALYVGWTWRNIVGSYTAHAPALVARPARMGDLDYETGANYDVAAAAEVLKRCEDIPDSAETDRQLITLIRLSLDELCDEVLSRDRNLERSLELLARLLRNAWELYRREWDRAVERHDRDAYPDPRPS